MKPQRGKTPRKTQKKTSSNQKDPVEVYCRLRPLENANDEVCCEIVSSTTVLLVPTEKSQAFKTGSFKETQYTFKFLFDDCTSQKALFDHVASPLVEDVLHGKNGLLFTYGITSSGKTYTMTGTPTEPGILPRCLDMIFNSIGDLQAKKYVFMSDKMNGYDVQTEADAMLERQRRDILPRSDTPKPPPTPKSSRKFEDTPRIKDPSKVEDIEEDNNYAVFVSYIEIYNNYVYDLLEELPFDPITGYRAPNSKVLREDGERNMYVSHCVEVEVKTTEEAFEVLLKGQKRRKVAHTALNTESSRSHSVFNIRLVQAPLDPIGEEVLQDKDKICISQLSLVDLAGSERLARTNNAGDRLREAGNINQSLMVLRTCMDMLRENQTTGSNKMVPYRDSKLTHLFKNYFDGEGKVRMIVCVNPKAEECDETVHVMRFAEVTQEVQVNRQQQVRFDLGLTPGRRRMNLQYKDAVAKMEEEGVLAHTAWQKFACRRFRTVPSSEAIPMMTYNMGAPFPIMELVDCSDESVIMPLIHFLQQRELRRQTLLTDLDAKHDAFRQKLIQTEKENVELKQKMAIMEEELSSREDSYLRVQKKLGKLAKTNEMLARTQEQYESERRHMESELQVKSIKIQKEKQEKERLKNDFRSKMALTNQQWEKNLEREKRRMQDRAVSEIERKERKLQMLRSIVNQESESTEYEYTPRRGPTVAPKPKPRYMTSTMASRIQAARSENDLRSTGSSSTTSTTTSRPQTRKYTAAARAPSPPPRGAAPVVNPRGHRRSKSSHEVWLDHKPEGSLELGTLVQPKMKKKKSVSKLEMKDTRDASKYVLTHQEQNSRGQVETQLVKGDVLPSAGGGTCVLFTDVEKITQTSPGDRKRRAEQLRPEDFEGEWTDTETRCNVAIEGHGLFKRQRNLHAATQS